MNANFILLQFLRRCVLLFGVIFVALAPVYAQQRRTPPASAPPTPRASPAPSLEKQLLTNILRDQRAIWTSPLHLRARDARFLAPLGLATAALFATDRRTGSAVDDDGSLPAVSRSVSRLGATYTTGGVAAAFYLFGRARGDARARETGLLGAEALINSGIVVEALKTVTQRPRPRADDASGEFFDGGNSFPSGHAISAWSLATVIAHEYGQHRPLARFGAYGLATAVSLARYTGRNHFLSDALVGSAMGYGIGRYVYLKHHDPNLDGLNGKGTSITRSKLLPLIAPQFHGGARRTRVYGVTLAWDF